MTDYNNTIFQPKKLSNTDFDKLSNFIYSTVGIKMPKEKKVMLESRLHKRLKVLNFNSYAEYCDFVFSPTGRKEEMTDMIDMITTNKTDFFRENNHFDFLKSTYLPSLLSDGSAKQLKVWSAGCSSGEEAYTLAMLLTEFKQNHQIANIDFNILATDISMRMLKQAHEGVYSMDKIDDIPLNLLHKYLLKNKNDSNKTVRVINDLRSKLSFKRINFMDGSYDVESNFDLIFCRNVLIYFDRETQERVINKLCRHLKKGSLFFLGHSESIMNMDVPLQQIQPTIYQKK